MVGSRIVSMFLAQKGPSESVARDRSPHRLNIIALARAVAATVACDLDSDFFRYISSDTLKNEKCELS